MIPWRNYPKQIHRRNHVRKYVQQRTTTSICLYIKEFCEETTIQGFRYLVIPNRHPLEVIMWGVTIVLAFLGAVILVIGSWTRYVANPTVVSLEKNYRDWDTVFPAFTLCYLDKVNSSRGKEQIKKLWGDVDESRKKYYMNFISHVANASLANLHEFQQYDGDSTLHTVDLEDLALNVQLDFHGDIMFGEDSSRVKIRRTVTELGHCFTWGSRIAQHFSEITKRTDQLSSEEVLAMPCKYVNLPCVVSVSELLSEVEFYVHPPDEMPMFGRDKSQIERKGEDREVLVVQRQMVASPELGRLSPVQRDCLFQDETHNSHPPIYTYNICKMECRKKMSLQFCNCIPFFYRTLGGMPICNTMGMACLARFKDNITYDVFRNRVSCPCYQQCESMDFTVDKETTEEIESLYEELEEKIQFHIKIEEYTKTRYRRDIIFSYEDLVVSFGGTVSLFLGCSILSGVELVYFFTIRLICRLWMKRQATNNTRSQQLRIVPMNTSLPRRVESCNIGRKDCELLEPLNSTFQFQRSTSGALDCRTPLALSDYLTAVANIQMMHLSFLTF